MKAKEINTLNVEHLVENYTITDQEEIRKALCMPKSVPESFLSKELKPIGIGVYRGDNLPAGWSANEHFTKGEYYMIYDGENGPYPISTKTGAGMKLTPKAWEVAYF